VKALRYRNRKPTLASGILEEDLEVIEELILLVGVPPLDLHATEPGELRAGVAAGLLLDDLQPL
jgi:hypothetical protein